MISILQKQNSAEYKPETDNIVLGDLIIQKYKSNDPLQRISAEKQYIHELWHKFFCKLSTIQQLQIVNEFKILLDTNSDFKDKVQILCGSLYSEREYLELHSKSINPNPEIVTEEKRGVKVDETVVLNFHNSDEEIHLGYLITELLSLSSASEIPNLNTYYESVLSAVEETSSKGILIKRKWQLENLSHQIISMLNSPIINSEFKDKTIEGLQELQKFAKEYQVMESETPAVNKA